MFPNCSEKYHSEGGIFCNGIVQTSDKQTEYSEYYGSPIGLSAASSIGQQKLCSPHFSWTAESVIVPCASSLSHSERTHREWRDGQRCSASDGQRWSTRCRSVASQLVRRIPAALCRSRCRSLSPSLRCVCDVGAAGLKTRACRCVGFQMKADLSR